MPTDLKRSMPSIEAYADAVASTDECSSCGWAQRLPGVKRALFGLPWACGRTGGPALERCEFYTDEDPWPDEESIHTDEDPWLDEESTHMDERELLLFGLER